MSVLVADCPRCGASEMTFDVGGANLTAIKHGWQRWYEVYCVCRRCGCATLFELSQEDPRHEHYFESPKGLAGHEGTLNHFTAKRGHISLRHEASQSPPEHLPDDIRNAFNEAATCYAVECWNAAGAMFRLCVDLATRPLLPVEEREGLNSKTRRDLGLRLPWLIKNGFIPPSLTELSACIREDGNDGVHVGNLTEEDAADLLDFTTTLLERLYTEPRRLELAKERRDKRRAPV